MRLDLRKLRFRQPKLVATHLCLLFGSRESRHYVRANTFMGPDPSAASALGGKVICSGSSAGRRNVSNRRASTFARARFAPASVNLMPRAGVRLYEAGVNGCLVRARGLALVYIVLG